MQERSINSQVKRGQKNLIFQKRTYTFNVKRHASSSWYQKACPRLKGSKTYFIRMNLKSEIPTGDFPHIKGKRKNCVMDYVILFFFLPNPECEFLSPLVSTLKKLHIMSSSAHSNKKDANAT